MSHNCGTAPQKESQQFLNSCLQFFIFFPLPSLLLLYFLTIFLHLVLFPPPFFSPSLFLSLFERESGGPCFPSWTTKASLSDGLPSLQATALMTSDRQVCLCTCKAHLWKQPASWKHWSSLVAGRTRKTKQAIKVVWLFGAVHSPCG